MNREIKNEILHGIETHYWESNGAVYIHDVNGPALFYGDGRVEYGLNGFYIPKNQFESITIEEREIYNADQRDRFLVNCLIDEGSNLDGLFETWSETEKPLPIEIIYQLEKYLTLMSEIRSVLEDYLYDVSNSITEQAPSK